MTASPTVSRAAPVAGRLGYARVAVAASLWGTWSLFFRPAEAHHPVSAAVESFMVFAGMFLVTAPLALRARGNAPTARLPWTAWLALGWLGVGDALNALCFFGAMQRAPVAVAVLTHYAAPVLIALASPWVLGSRPRRATWAAMGLALAGLVLVLAPWRGTHAPGAHGDLLGGAILGGLSAVFYAGHVLLLKYSGQWFTADAMLAWHLPVSMAVLALAAPAGSFAMDAHAVAWLMGAAWIPGAAGAWLFYGALSRVDADRASVLTLLEPLVAVLVGVTVWHEHPSPTAAVGAALVLWGAWLVARPGGVSASPG